MEQQQPQNPFFPRATPQISQLTPNPTIILEQPKSKYLARLFRGRLNRQNYILGSTTFALVPLLCFMVVIFNILLSPSTFAMPYLDPTNPSAIITPQVSILSLLETPTNEVCSTIGFIFMILSIPYLFSLQIRRLHDLNLNGWLWIANLVPLVSLFALPLPGANTPSPTLFLATNVVSLAASVFSFYVSLWPGTKGPNKYGEKPLAKSSFLRDILQIQ